LSFLVWPVPHPFTPLVCFCLLQAFLVKNRTMSRVYWLGLSDQKVESQWLWVDGSPLKLSFLSTGEPNDSSNEDYGTMAIDGCWNDINCYMTDYWISVHVCCQVLKKGKPLTGGRHC
uniref:C-type lectin domain-containing protein n=1 Tax=Gopherus agassizii TaxID=38772 RepID=A0A452GUI9_9SAUR